MKFAIKVKELRMKNSITQERLAEYLGVSFQAVSKWENGTSLPDINLLKPISNFFGVSIDFLLDNEKNKEDEFVENLLEEYQVLNNKGKIEDAISLVRNGLKEYPRNHLLMSKLVQSLITITKSTHEKDMQKNAQEALKLCQIIIDDSNDYGLIDSAIRSSFYAYVDLKDFDKAIELANRRPSIWHSKEVLLTSAYRGEEANVHHQKTILTLVDMLQMYIFSLTYKVYGGEKYSAKEKIRITKAAINILETVFYDENYLFYSNRLRRLYTFLGLYYAVEKEEELMYESLQKAKDLAIYFDSLEKDENYTSVIIDTQVHKPDGNTKNAEWTDIYVYRNRLERKEFDPYRDSVRFEQLLA